MKFEERFFGPGNRLRWEDITTGRLLEGVRTRLGPFLDDLRRDLDTVVLPRVRPDGSVSWYVLCRSARAARIASDECRAFLGPSYSDFEGQPRSLDSNDPVEAAVLDRCGRYAFRIEIPEAGVVGAARERLRLMVRLLAERPARHGLRIRPTGRVLRDYEYALIAGDGQAAADCIEELRATGRLGAANLLFLETRRLAALNRWSAILALPELTTLLSITRPRRVTEALVQAVYATHLRSFESAGDVDAALRATREEVLPRFGPLYASAAGLSGFEVDASFLLVAASSGNRGDPELQSRLSAYEVSDPRRAFLVAIAARLHRPDSQGLAADLSVARSAFADADVDRAFAIAKDLAPSFDRAVLLLRCAQEMGSLEAGRTALSAVEVLRPDEKARLVAHAVLKRLYGDLLARQPASSAPASPGSQTGPTTSTVPEAWDEWLERLKSPARWPAAVTVAEAGAREWDTVGPASDPTAVERMSELILAERPEWGQTAFRDALPYLVESCLARGAEGQLRSVYESIFLTLALDEHTSVPQLEAMLRVVEARLRLGVGEQEYRELVEHLASAIDSLNSPMAIDIALNGLEMLVVGPCPDPGIRQGFVVRVMGLFQRWFRRSDAAQREIFASLAEESGVTTTDLAPAGAVESDDQASELWQRLAGQRLALYSLRESALRRAARVIQALCGEAKVDIFSDEVGGSSALRTAAVNADIFLVATAAAKHAATDFIAAHRPTGRTTLYARGQGSASLIDLLRQHLHGQTPR